MKHPESLDAATAAWLRQQIDEAVALAVKPLARTVDANDDFVCGLHAALFDLLRELLPLVPPLAGRLAPAWGAVAQRYDAVRRGGWTPPGRETAGLLEPRKMLFRTVAALGLWRWPQSKRNEGLLQSP